MSPFAQLLQAAHAQPDEQRLLFVFAAAELPEQATAEQREEFARGQGGSLTPLMCVDKAPDEVGSFQALADEARRMGPPWQVVFVAALSGKGPQPPADAQVDQALQRMVDAVKHGGIEGFLAFDPQGQLLHLA